MVEHHPIPNDARRHRVLLLLAHIEGPTTGDRAADRVGLRVADAAYTTRLAELERDGYLRRTGEYMPSQLGHPRMVRELTADGRALALALIETPGMPWPRR
jgi:hypothetical protein